MDLLMAQASEAGIVLNEEELDEAQRELLLRKGISGSGPKLKGQGGI